MSEEKDELFWVEYGRNEALKTQLYIFYPILWLSFGLLLASHIAANGIGYYILVGISLGILLACTKTVYNDHEEPFTLSD